MIFEDVWVFVIMDMIDIERYSRMSLRTPLVFAAIWGYPQWDPEGYA